MILRNLKAVCCRQIETLMIEFLKIKFIKILSCEFQFENRYGRIDNSRIDMGELQFENRYEQIDNSRIDWAN